MSWLFERRTVPSAHNGTIEVHRFLGEWTITVDGCNQTSPYQRQMWAESFARVAVRYPTLKVRHVLMLGLAGGGAIRPLYKRFRIETLTVIDHDAQMAAVARDLKLYAPHPEPAIIIADAQEGLMELDRQYDLIIVDLFSGEDPSALCIEPQFIALLKQRLSGALLVNVYKRAEYLHTIAQRFNDAQIFDFKANRLGLFSDAPTRA